MSKNPMPSDWTRKVKAPMQEFSLQAHEYIALCDLLKAMNLCDSGGQAKMVISEGKVIVNGEVELRKRCKIRKSSIVEFSGEKIKVTA